MMTIKTGLLLRVWLTLYNANTLAVDGWAVNLHFVQRGLGGAAPRPRCTKCNSPPINGQCTNHRIVV